MNEKYIGKQIVLPKDAAALVMRMQDELTKRLGFKPSLSETIAVAVTRWIDEELS